MIAREYALKKYSSAYVERKVETAFEVANAFHAQSEQIENV